LHLMGLLLILFMIQAFPLFDIAETIEEYEQAVRQEFWINLVAGLCLGLGSIFTFWWRPLVRWGGLSAVIVFLSGLISSHLPYTSVKSFERDAWGAGNKSQFLEARSLVLSKAFQRYTKMELWEKLGPPDQQTEEQLTYKLSYWDWELSFQLDACCVIQSTLTRPPFSI
ncbi:MAG: hypothetical protein AAF598_15825, partial [Bacteroidota bacterium]